MQSSKQSSKRNLWLKIILPVVVLSMSAGAFKLVNAAADKEPEVNEVDTRPLVAVESVHADTYPVSIKAYGTLEPIEMTSLAASVSGEVISWNSEFIEGGLLRRGETLFAVDPAPYEAAVTLAEANLMSAQANLIEQKALAEIAADEARRHPEKTYTDLFLRKPQLLSAEASVKSSEAALAIAQRDLRNCVVKAPFDALVVTKSLGQGQYVGTGSPVASLYNVESARVLVPVPGFEVDFLPEKLQGATVTVSMPVTGASRQASIRHDLGVIDEATRMAHLMIELKDPYALNSPGVALKYGAYTEVTFAGKTLNQVYRLPQSAVRQQQVWVVNPENELEARTVDIVREEPGFYYIRTGLNEGDRLVMTLPEYPQNGMPVKVEGDAEEEDEADESAADMTAATDIAMTGKEG